MRILISGASGFIGTPLSSYFKSRGHEVVPLSRQSQAQDFEGFDVAIHLAGEPISLKPWSKEKRKKIFESRKYGTQLFAHRLAHLHRPPKLFISASAVGFYGDRGDEDLDEGSLKGQGFLSDVCEAWEKASFALEERKVRIVHARFGVVLSSTGGSLKKILPLYRLGLGARLGSGRQWMSWIALEDLIRAIEHVIYTPNLEGAINIVSPFPTRQELFSLTLSTLLQRPHWIHLPAWFLWICFGRATELLLYSQKVKPSKLLASNFSFDYPELQSALQRALFK